MYFFQKKTLCKLYFEEFNNNLNLELYKAKLDSKNKLN